MTAPSLIGWAAASAGPTTSAPSSTRLSIVNRCLMLASLVECSSRTIRTPRISRPPLPEEPAGRPRVSVPVIGNVAHVIVDPVRTDLPLGHRVQLGAHVSQVLVGWLRAVPAPDHHRHLADLALGDPAHVVLVEPRRDALGPAQLTPDDAVKRAQE